MPRQPGTASYRDEGPRQEDQGKDGNDVHRKGLLLGFDRDLVHLVRPLHHLVAGSLRHQLECLGGLNTGVLAQGLELLTHAKSENIRSA